MKVALIHDWLTGMRGGEKVLEALCEIFPRAKLFSLLYNEGTLSSTIEEMDISTSFIQKMPFKTKHYRSFLPLFPFAVEQFCLDDFDLVISSSHCVAKSVLVRSDTCHICYCHTPMRYVWEQYFVYYKHLPLYKKVLMSYFSNKLRIWDTCSASRVDYFVANSRHVSRRIKRIYGRESFVIPPPVDISRFASVGERCCGEAKYGEGYFLIVSALVSYKRLDLAVLAFNILGYPLIIVGKGEEEANLRSMANSNVKVLGYSSDDEIDSLYAGCRAFIFPGEEDFGITALEAHASGKPVIAFGKGGVTETVREGENGMFFHEPAVESLVRVVREFETKTFDSELIKASAFPYSKNNFKEKLENFVLSKFSDFKESCRVC